MPDICGGQAPAATCWAHFADAIFICRDALNETRRFLSRILDTGIFRERRVVGEKHTYSRRAC